MDPLAPLIASLRAEGRPRVWSLVITAFGDLVQHRGGAITTTRLNALMGRIGVESGALRTALSRLDRDGWLVRERRGRSSLCRLSSAGLAQFGPATSTIYAPADAADIDQWSLSVTLGETGAQTVRLGPASDPPRGDVLVRGTLDRLSPAFRAAWIDPACSEALQALAQDIGCLEAVASPIDAAAARLLLIHRWRRIVLRFPEPLPQLLPDIAPIPYPRAAVARAYAALGPLAERWLDSPLGDEPAMPPADGSFERRFGGSTRA